MKVCKCGAPYREGLLVWGQDAEARASWLWGWRQLLPLEQALVTKGTPGSGFPSSLTLSGLWALFSCLLRPALHFPADGALPVKTQLAPYGAEDGGGHERAPAQL